MFQPDAFWRDVLAQDRAALPRYFCDDAVIRWHCTNEQFIPAEFVRANCDYPGGWAGELERTERMGSLVVTAVRVWSTDRPLSFHAVSFFRLSEGKILSLDEYWGDDGPPPQWRAALGLGAPIGPEADYDRSFL